MRKAIFGAAVLALAACGGAETDGTQQGPLVNEVAEVDPDADAGFEAVAPGRYEVAHADGSVDQLTIGSGMLWSMVFADGTPAGGTIFAQDGRNCFVTEGQESHQCFQGSEPAEDGSMVVTAEDGQVLTVRPVEAFAAVGSRPA
jgi:hypothetical protein